MKKYLRPLLVLGLCLAAFLAPASVAYALWSTAATGTLNVSVASSPANSGPAAPEGLACTSSKNDKAVTLSWKTVPGVTYAVLHRGTSTVVVSPVTSPKTLNDKNMTNNVQLVIRASDASGSSSSAQYFDIQLAAGTCVVLS